MKVELLYLIIETRDDRLLPSIQHNLNNEDTMEHINNIKRFIDCMGSDPSRTSLHSIAMLDEYIMATDGHMGYAQRVSLGSIPSGRIEKAQITKKSEVKLTNKQVTVDGMKVKFNPERPFTQSFIDNYIRQTNDQATIIDPKGLLKLIKKFSLFTTINPANGRKRNRKRVLMLIDMTNGALLGCDEHDVSERVVIGDCSKFIEFPRTVDNKNPVSFDFFAFHPMYFIQMLKEMAKECDNIAWRFNRDNACGAYLFHDAGETDKNNLSQFYLLMPMRQ